MTGYLKKSHFLKWLFNSLFLKSNYELFPITGNKKIFKITYKMLKNNTCWQQHINADRMYLNKIQNQNTKTWGGSWQAKVICAQQKAPLPKVWNNINTQSNHGHCV